MEIYQLRTFLAVARLGSLTRAAEQMHISQPAVSKQLKALEEELGALLFDRLSFGMALTKAGETLLPHAERTLFEAVELLNTAVESVVDRVGPEWHALSKRAKDLGSAAVLLSLLFAGGVWGAALWTWWRG